MGSLLFRKSPSCAQALRSRDGPRTPPGNARHRFPGIHNITSPKFRASVFIVLLVSRWRLRMSYSVDLRERVVNYVRNGGSLAAAAKLFQVGRATIYRWLGAPDLQPKPAKERKRKLDKAALAAHVRDFPDALLRERAAHFGVTINAIWVALKKLAITKKTTRYSESRCDERITFLRQLRAWVTEHGWKNVVYFDESGFQAAVHRPHGWAPGATRSLVKSPATTINGPISLWRNGAKIGSRPCCSRQAAPI